MDIADTRVSDIDHENTGQRADIRVSGRESEDAAQQADSSSQMRRRNREQEYTLPQPASSREKFKQTFGYYPAELEPEEERKLLHAFAGAYNSVDQYYFKLFPTLNLLSLLHYERTLVGLDAKINRNGGIESEEQLETVRDTLKQYSMQGRL